MMDANRIEELVEKYLMGRLSELEEIEFDSIKDTEKVIQEIEWKKSVLEAIKAEERSAMKKRLEKIEGELSSHLKILPNNENKSPKIKKRWFRIYPYVAAAVLVIISGIFLVNRNMNSDQAIYAEYMEAPGLMNGNQVRSGGADISDSERIGLLYNNGKFDDFLDVYSEHVATDSSFLLYAGYIYLERGDFNKAAQLLTQLHANSAIEIEVQAKWYSSMCYFELGDIEMAKSLLEELVRNESAFDGKSRDLSRIAQHNQDLLSKIEF